MVENAEQTEIMRVIATAGVVLVGILIGSLGVVFGLYIDRARPDASGKRAPILGPLRATAWLIVVALLVTAAVVGVSVWWFSDPSQTLYNAVLALFLAGIVSVPFLAAAAVWYWLS